ncbi:acyl carrier protein [Priestia megaterium]
MRYRDIPSVLPCIVNEERFKCDILLKSKYKENKLNQVEIINNLNVEPNENNKSLVIENKLKQLFSTELKIPKDRLDEETSFGEFGVDSIILAELVKKIEKLVGEKLDPSILLEFPTIRSLSNHLIKYRNIPLDEFNKELESKNDRSTSFSKDVEEHLEEEIKPVDNMRKKIAVIGMGCDFPGKAKNVDVFGII